jgi:hypothetical protein
LLVTLYISNGLHYQGSGESRAKVIQFKIGAPIELILKLLQGRQASVRELYMKRPIISDPILKGSNIVPRQDSHHIAVILTKYSLNVWILRGGDCSVILMEIVRWPPCVEVLRGSRHRGEHPIKGVGTKSMRIMKQENELKNLSLVRSESETPAFI